MRLISVSSRVIFHLSVWMCGSKTKPDLAKTTRLWAKRSSRPRAVKPQQFDYGYLFGAVCPSNGKTEALITPLVNKDAMMLHLDSL